MPITGVPDELPITGVLDEFSITGMPDQLTITGAPDKLPITGVPDELNITGVQEETENKYTEEDTNIDTSNVNIEHEVDHDDEASIEYEMPEDQNFTINNINVIQIMDTVKLGSNPETGE